MHRLSEQLLRDWLDWQIGQRPASDCTFLRYFLAIQVLRHYLGEGWVDEYLGSGATGQSRSGREFLRADHQPTGAGEFDADGFRHQTRVESLAELLHNLHDVQGMGGRRNGVLEGDLEATYADLVFAQHLVRKGIDVRFRETSGVRGSDYDFDAGGGVLCCEVKCKLEATDLSSATIANALDKARKQLPTGRASLVGVRAPEQWVSDPSMRSVFDATITSFLRNTRRVVVVLVQWEETQLSSAAACVVPHFFGHYLNEHSPLFAEPVRSLARVLTTPEQFDSPSAGRWTEFHSLVDLVLASRS